MKRKNLILLLSLALVLSACGRTQEETISSRRTKTETTTEDQFLSESTSASVKDKDNDNDNNASTPLLRAIRPKLEEGDLNYSGVLFSGAGGVNSHIVHAYGGLWFAQKGEYNTGSDIYFNADDSQPGPFRVCSVPYAIGSDFILCPVNQGRNLCIIAESEILHYDLTQGCFQQSVPLEKPLYSFNWSDFGWNGDEFSAPQYAVTESKIAVFQRMNVGETYWSSFLASSMEVNSVDSLLIIDPTKQSVEEIKLDWWKELPEWILEGKNPEPNKPAIYTVYSQIGLHGSWRYYAKFEYDFARREPMQGEQDGIYRCRWDGQSEEERVLLFSELPSREEQVITYTTPEGQAFTYNRSRILYFLSEKYMAVSDLTDYILGIGKQADLVIKLPEHILSSDLGKLWFLKEDDLWFRYWEKGICVMNLHNGQTEVFLSESLNTTLDILELGGVEDFFYPQENNIWAGNETHLYRISRSNPRRDYELVYEHK